MDKIIENINYEYKQNIIEIIKQLVSINNINLNLDELIDTAITIINENDTQ